jgi:hypothetical protein
MPRDDARSGERLRIVVLGYIVRGPLGGLVWHHLQYVMGLARMGHDVCFLEDSGDTPWCCYDPSRDVTDADPTFGLGFADRAFQAGGIRDRWAYHNAHTGRWHGPLAEYAVDRCRKATLLLNLSGANRLRPWTRTIPHRVLIDTDPVFTQIRHLTDADRRQNAEQHTAFFSFAENIRRGASIPNDGFPWQPTRQPIVLDAWPVVDPPDTGRFTTVMQWDSYAAREHEGRRFGMKSNSFVPYLSLPGRVGPLFEIAVGGTAAAQVLGNHGWAVRNPIKAIGDPLGYQRFLQHSKAEFTVAKHGYVVSRSGWFSERSAAYLASGRPVVTQDTGFSDWIPTGNGLLAFTSADEAAQSVNDVIERYEHHRRAARALAESHFDSTDVLQHLVDRVLSPPATPSTSHQ